jgi:peptide-methionine (S)-S-oxide reductase
MDMKLMKKLIALSTIVYFIFSYAWAMERATLIPAPHYNPPSTEKGLETIILAGGCFWGVQGVYQHLRGVTQAISGYAGGSSETAHYEIVSNGQTGHAEAVEVTYDPKKITLGDILQVFFSVAHDPTQLNAQGPDEGTQYRSAIFTKDKIQDKITKDYIDQLNKTQLFKHKIVTKLEPGKVFYPAEDYHQDYLEHNPTKPYIVFNDLPKIQNLEKLYPQFYKAEASLTSNLAKGAQTEQK